MSEKENLLCIVDGNNVLLRAHYALKRHNLMTESGLATGAVFGAINSHINLVRMLDPTHLVWFFDAGKSKKRTELFEGYKASRKSKEDIRHQFGVFEKFLSLVGVRHYSEQGVEADDLIAHAVLEWQKDIPKVIVSADHDLRQLVSSDPRVSVLKPKQGKSPQKIYTEKAVEEEYGVTPDKLSDVWAMCGDSSDDIPGVPRVGYKTALKIYREAGESLEKALEEAPKLQGHEDTVRRNKELIHLVGGVGSTNVQLDECLFSKENYHTESLMGFFEQWEMNSLRLKTKGIGLYG